jgi:hypothetical protein
MACRSKKGRAKMICRRLLKYGFTGCFAVISLFSQNAMAAVTTCDFTVTGQSDEGTPVSVTVHLSLNDASGLLTMTITNTGAYGSLTSIAFNVPGNRTATSATIVTQPSGGHMDPLGTELAPYTGAPYGTFEFGLTTETDYLPDLNPGIPLQGVQPGEFVVATFIISSPSGITTCSFCNELNPSGIPVFARFRGDGLGATGATAITVTQVPEPSALTLLGSSSLLAIGLIMRKRSRAHLPRKTGGTLPG